MTHRQNPSGPSTSGKKNVIYFEDSMLFGWHWVHPSYRCQVAALIVAQIAVRLGIPPGTPIDPPVLGDYLGKGEMINEDRSRR